MKTVRYQFIMTVLLQINRDKIIRKKAANAEIMIRSFKYLLNNNNVDSHKRVLMSFIFFTKNSSKYFKTKTRNYCVMTKRPRWVLRKVYLSRQQFKKCMTTGNFMGMRKACW